MTSSLAPRALLKRLHCPAVSLSRCTLAPSSSLMRMPSSLHPQLFLHPHRCMANKEQKNRDKLNMKKKQEKTKAVKSHSSSSASSSSSVDLPPALLSLLDTFEVKSATVLANFSSHLSTLSVTRLSPDLLDSLPVPLSPPPASPTPLSSLATIAHKSSTQLLLTLHDPSHLKPILRALSSFSLPGVGPLSAQAEGEGVVVGYGKGGKEVREEMRLALKRKGEEVKGKVRELRQAALAGMKKAGGTDEESQRAKGRLQTMVDETTAEIDRRIKEKEKELNEA